MGVVHMCYVGILQPNDEGGGPHKEILEENILFGINLARNLLILNALVTLALAVELVRKTQNDHPWQEVDYDWIKLQAPEAQVAEVHLERLVKVLKTHKPHKEPPQVHSNVHENEVVEADVSGVHILSIVKDSPCLAPSVES